MSVWEYGLTSYSEVFCDFDLILHIPRCILVPVKLYFIFVNSLHCLFAVFHIEMPALSNIYIIRVPFHIDVIVDCNVELSGTVLL